jgi:hypothetical protein
MNNLKFPQLISASLLILTLGNIANAVPITYTGSKGQYTVDKEIGTYKGCLFKESCILLGPNEKVGPSTWKNGDYTYSVNTTGIRVNEKNKEIFQDSFVNTPASAIKLSTPEVKYGLITDKCIGSACIGMTYGQLKAKLGKKVTFIESNSKDMRGFYKIITVFQDNKEQYKLYFDEHSKPVKNDYIINHIETSNTNYRFKSGIGPGSSIVNAQKVYGKGTFRLHKIDGYTEEFVDFNTQCIAFKVKPISGIYTQKRSRHNKEYSIETKKFKPNTVIDKVLIFEPCGC